MSKHILNDESLMCDNCSKLVNYDNYNVVKVNGEYRELCNSCLFKLEENHIEYKLTSSGVK